MRKTINIDCKHIWNAIQRLREADVNNINIVENEIAKVISEYGVEQKHGHWIWNPKKECFWCSNCKTEEDYNNLDSEPMYKGYPDFIRWNKYCRFCGAKMDEVTQVCIL